MSLTKQQLLDLINTALASSPHTINSADHRDLENKIVDAIFTDRLTQIGDIKEIACNSDYITKNFKTGTSLTDEGLGLAPGASTTLGVSTGERFGWAICNGKNGTINKMGRVAIGYDSINYPLGSVAGSNTGGEKTHTLLVTEMPPHSHLMSQGNVAGNAGGTPYIYTSGDDATMAIDARTSGGIQTPPTYITGGAGSSATNNTTGGSTIAHNNMQPYIVTLFIQKIS